VNVDPKYFRYLNELKKRILFTLVVFFVAALAGFVYYENIIRFMVRLLSLEKSNIVFTSPFQFINLAVSCGFTTGTFAVVPLIILQTLLFLKPALRIKEFKSVLKTLPYAVVLFFIGFVFGALIMKWQIEIFVAKSISLGIGNVLDISNILSMILLTSVLMGFGFQFPIILLLLLRLHVITPHQLSTKRKWVYLGSFLFAVFLPPDSILADVMLAMPFILSFEMTLFINWLMEKRS
jgi:sec-independent protein translocase protein TatC